MKPASSEPGLYEWFALWPTWAVVGVGTLLCLAMIWCVWVSLALSQRPDRLHGGQSRKPQR